MVGSAGARREQKQAGQSALDETDFDTWTEVDWCASRIDCCNHCQMHVRKSHEFNFEAVVEMYTCACMHAASSLAHDVVSLCTYTLTSPCANAPDFLFCMHLRKCASLLKCISVRLRRLEAADLCALECMALCILLAPRTPWFCPQRAPDRRCSCG